MTTIKSENDIFNGSFAEQRRSKLHLIYRFKTRALIAACMARQFMGKIHEPRVLELGAAEGATLAELRRLLGPGHYLGVEYSQELVAMAKDLPNGVKVVHGNCENLPVNIKDGSYDLVIALALLEHLAEPDLALREAFRALAPCGLFIATCPSPFWDKVATRLGLLPDVGHQTDLSLSGLRKLAKSAGFAFVAEKKFMWAPIAVLPYLRIPVSPGTSLKVDCIINSIRILDLLFVNQCLVARKPHPLPRSLENRIVNA